MTCALKWLELFGSYGHHFWINLWWYKLFRRPKAVEQVIQSFPLLTLIWCQYLYFWKLRFTAPTKVTIWLWFKLGSKDTGIRNFNLAPLIAWQLLSQCYLSSQLMSQIGDICSRGTAIKTLEKGKNYSKI